MITGPVARGKPGHSAAAGAWGLLRNVFQEFAAFKWVGMDVDAASPHVPVLPANSDAFGCASHSNMIATPRMLPHQMPAPSQGFTSRTGMGQGAWIITGGLGGLGLLFAQWAALQLAARVRLLDVAVRGLPGFLSQQMGAAIEVVKADCSSRAEAAHGMEGGRVYGSIEGLMHAAGVLQDALLLKQTASSFRAVLSGKVRWALREPPVMLALFCHCMTRAGIC